MGSTLSKWRGGTVRSTVQRGRRSGLHLIPNSAAPPPVRKVDASKFRTIREAREASAAAVAGDKDGLAPLRKPLPLQGIHPRPGRPRDRAHAEDAAQRHKQPQTIRKTKDPLPAREAPAAAVSPR